MVVYLMVCGLLGLGLFLTFKLEWAELDLKFIDRVCICVFYPLLFLTGIPLLEFNRVMPMVETSLAVLCILSACWLITYAFTTAMGKSGACRVLMCQIIAYPRFVMCAAPILLLVLGPETLVLILVMAVVPVILTKVANQQDDETCHTFSMRSDFALPSFWAIIIGVAIAFLPHFEIELQLFQLMFQLLCSSQLLLVLMRSAIEASQVSITWRGLLYVLSKALLALIIGAGMLQVGFGDEAIVITVLTLIVPAWFLLQVKDHELPLVQRAGALLAESQFWFFLMLLTIVPIFMFISAAY